MAEIKKTTPAAGKKVAVKTTTGPAAGGSGPAGWLASASQFIREVKTELKKVTWPNKKQTISSTTVVLVLVAVISLFLGVVDLTLSRLVRVVIAGG